MKRVRVAVVDDSTFIRKALARMLGDHPQIKIVGAAGSGEELLAHLDTWEPDVVTLDLDMPGIGGLETLDRLLAQRPTPVIILSTHSGKGAPMTIEALHRGATDFIDKQRYSLVDFESLRAILIEKIFHVTGTVAGGKDTAASLPPKPEPPAVEAPAEPEPRATRFDLVALGASTGGPPTVQRILEDVGREMPVPIVVVQHMPVGFTQAFAERLNTHLPLHVMEARKGEPLLPHSVYIAPAGWHLKIVRTSDGHLACELSQQPAELTHIPSIDVLFHSVAQTLGPRAVAALLTGMGRDGAQGLMSLRTCGAYTLAQDEASSIVFGMPRAAAALGAAVEIAALDGLGDRVRELVLENQGEDGKP